MGSAPLIHRSSSCLLQGAEPSSIRFDEAETPVFVTRNDCIRLDASRMRRTPQGGLRGPAGLSRVGVFPYRMPDGSVRRELRPPEEVFHADSVVTLDQAPITALHPPELLNKENTSKFSKGQVTAIHNDATHLLGEAVIQDSAVIDGVMSGKWRDFSPGYKCSIDATPGVWNGESYDVIQRNIRYNHVALMPPDRGRQGPSVALRFDAAIITETPMIVRLDGKDYDLSNETERAAYHAAMQAAVDAQKARADKAEGRADGLETELKPIKAEKVIAARQLLETNARRVMGEKAKDVKFDGLDDRQVREKALGKDMTGKSDSYVEARFDQLMESPPAATAVVEDPALRSAFAAMTPGGSPPQSTVVPASWTNRWEQPLTASKNRK